MGLGLASGLIIYLPDLVSYSTRSNEPSLPPGRKEAERGGALHQTLLCYAILNSVQFIPEAELDTSFLCSGWTVVASWLHFAPWSTHVTGFLLRGRDEAVLGEIMGPAKGWTGRYEG